MALPSIRINVAVPFPARVQGVGGISVTKVNGVYTIKPDFTALADVVPDSSVWANIKIWYFNATTNTYALISLQELFVAVNPSAGIGTRIVTVAGGVVVAVTDTVIILNKAAPSATAFTLPLVSARNPLGMPVDIYDWKGNGGDMTFTPAGGDLIMGSANPWVVGSGGAVGTGGKITLIPNVGIGGWLVK